MTTKAVGGSGMTTGMKALASGGRDALVAGGEAVASSARLFASAAKTVGGGLAAGGQSVAAIAMARGQAVVAGAATGGQALASFAVAGAQAVASGLATGLEAVTSGLATGLEAVASSSQFLKSGADAVGHALVTGGNAVVGSVGAGSRVVASTIATGIRAIGPAAAAGGKAFASIGQALTSGGKAVATTTLKSLIAGGKFIASNKLPALMIAMAAERVAVWAFNFHGNLQALNASDAGFMVEVHSSRDGSCLLAEPLRFGSCAESRWRMSGPWLSWEDTRVVIEPAGGSLNVLCLDAACMRCVGRGKSDSFQSMMCMAGMFGDGRLEHVEIRYISRAVVSLAYALPCSAARS